MYLVMSVSARSLMLTKTSATGGAPLPFLCDAEIYYASSSCVWDQTGAFIFSESGAVCLLAQNF